MPTPAPLVPQESSLDRLMVRRPVSSRHGARWASQLAHLLGRQTHRVCSCAMQVLVARTAAALPVKIAYCRSPAAKLAPSIPNTTTRAGSRSSSTSARCSAARTSSGSSGPSSGPSLGRRMYQKGLQAFT